MITYIPKRNNIQKELHAPYTVIEFGSLAECFANEYTELKTFQDFNKAWAYMKKQNAKNTEFIYAGMHMILDKDKNPVEYI